MFSDSKYMHYQVINQLISLNECYMNNIARHYYKLQGTFLLVSIHVLYFKVGSLGKLESLKRACKGYSSSEGEKSDV